MPGRSADERKKEIKMLSHKDFSFLFNVSSSQHFNLLCSAINTSMLCVWLGIMDDAIHIQQISKYDDKEISSQTIFIDKRK